VATVAAIELAGARPVLVDIEPGRYTIDPRAIEKAITPRTKAVLPVHLYGAPADLAPILALAHERGIRVIEDACQAHGARYEERAVGAWADFGCFSFYPTKNLGAYGDGGMAVTNDVDLADRARLIRTYGWAERDKSVIRGLNSRLDELHAAMLRVRLGYLEEGNERRRTLASLYEGELAGIPDLELPVEPAHSRHVYHLYVVRTPRRDDLRRFLVTRGIGTLVHYPIPVHLQPGYEDIGYPPGSLPESERAAAEILSLPLSPGLSDELAMTVAGAVRDFFKT
jgi:dTDP-4-amino-4,6-dideoxygalactose transaminase